MMPLRLSGQLLRQWGLLVTLKPESWEKKRR